MLINPSLQYDNFFTVDGKHNMLYLLADWPGVMAMNEPSPRLQPEDKVCILIKTYSDAVMYGYLLSNHTLHSPHWPD